jgi:flavin-dependent dehydrogenase
MGVIAIIGAGPAGCAAALTLRRYVPDLRVALIDMHGMAMATAPVAGETLSPGVLPLLRYLGMDGDFLRAGHLPAGGTASAWGTAQVFERDYLFSGRGIGWHLDRRSFDRWLLNQAEAAGAQCIRASATHASRLGSQWCIELKDGEAVIAEAIIDATGRAAWLTRRQGSFPHRDDALVGEVRWYVHDQLERHTAGALIEATPDGWWYSATLPGQRGVAMFMTDADLQKRTNWEERLAVAPLTSARLAPWNATGETAMRIANSQQSCTVAGDGWACAGDAAAAFDPISSLGIGFALRSGMEVARVAAAAAEQHYGPAMDYRNSIHKIYVDYRMRLRSIYQQEMRWPQALFWARRQAGCFGEDVKISRHKFSNRGV